MSVKGWICAGLCWVSVGCSSSNNGGGDSPSAKTPSEALARLSDQQRESFESWKTALVKSCDAGLAFGLPPSSDNTPTRLVDVAVLMKTNSNSLLVRGSDGSFALLGYPAPSQGTSTTHAEQSLTIDGNSQSITADTNNTGYDCIVKLYGQVVYTATLSPSVPLQGAWMVGTSPQGLSEQVSLSPLPGGSLSQVDGSDIVRTIATALAPNNSVPPFLASTLGLSLADAQSIFSADGAYAPQVDVAIDALAKDFWFDLSEPELVAPSDALNSAFAGTTLGARVFVQPNSFTIDKISNSADNGPVSIAASLKLSRDGAKVSYQVTQVASANVSATAPSDAQGCLAARVNGLVETHASATSATPALNDAVEPCERFYADALSDAYTNGVLSRALDEVLSPVTPGANVDYRGWDVVFTNLAINAQLAGTSVASAVDPAGILARYTTPMATYLSALSASLSSAKTINVKPVQSTVYALGPHWSLTGQVVEASLIGRMVRDADAAYDPFQDSIIDLLSSLAADPHSSEPALAFAETLDDDYKTLAKSDLALAQSLNYADFSDHVFARILQDRPSRQDLQDWNARLQTINDALAKTPALASSSGDLTRAAIRWLNSGQTDLGGVAPAFSELNNAETPFSAAVSQEISALASGAVSLANAQPALTFAGSLSADYKSRAARVYQLATTPALGLSDWATDFYANILSTRPSPDKLAGFENTLQGAVDFQAAEASRMQGSDPFTVSNNDSARVALTKQALTEGWTSDDFGAVTQMAAMARISTACTHTGPGVSAAVQCAFTSSTLSRTKGELLDPAFGDRYGARAQAMADDSSLLSDPTFFSMQYAVRDAFFSGKLLWVSCSNADFTSRGKQLDDSVHRLVGTSDFSAQMQLESQIRTLLDGDCGSLKH